MSEYYSRWEVERRFSDYEERLEEQRRRIEYLEQRREEEEEYLSDDEKKVEGKRLRDKLENKYGCSFQKVVQKMNYNDKNEFGDFYFAAFDYYEIKTGVIPKVAFEKARKEQIQNILFYTIINFEDRIAWFGSKLKYLNKEHTRRFTNEQCILIADLGESSLLSDKQKSIVRANSIPKQSCYSNQCLLI